MKRLTFRLAMSQLSQKVLHPGSLWIRLIVTLEIPPPAVTGGLIVPGAQGDVVQLGIGTSTVCVEKLSHFAAPEFRRGAVKLAPPGTVMVTVPLLPLSPKLSSPVPITSRTKSTGVFGVRGVMVES